MRLLLTNDDGILAHGLDCLEQAAKPLGEVTVVAPDREQSATSHSLTLHHPIRPVRRGDRRWPRGSRFAGSRRTVLKNLTSVPSPNGETGLPTAPAPAGPVARGRPPRPPRAAPLTAG